MDDEKSAHGSDCEGGTQVVEVEKDSDTTISKGGEVETKCAVSLSDSVQEPSKSTQYRRIKRELKYWVEVFGVIGGLAGLVVLILQFSAMEQQTAAMQGQLEEMQRARIEDERAWVAPYDFEPEQAGDSVFFRIFYKNTGRTPAGGCDGVAHFVNDLKRIPLKDVRPPSNEDSQLLAPDATAAVDIGTFPKSLIWQVKTNGAPFYIYGTIWYDDIFGKHHWSQFCVEMTGSMDEGASLRCLAMPVHNSCDDIQSTQAN